MILGTSGHVDHGKTSLVKALTGVDTDRLPEEKKRGITLELGFAHLTLPDGRVLGVVDVPGHERFVKAMAAGAGGIDLGLLVVAADEGVMPQTREHIDICSLLGVRRGLVVLTKADLLPPLGAEWEALVRDDLRAAVQGTFLEGAPVMAVSARSGAGLPELTAAIAAMAAGLAERPADGPAFLPIDRAFSVKGFGCVVTGTLLSGTLKLDELASLLPGLPGPFRVRSLQVHGQSVEQVRAGQRVAVNLTGLQTAQVHRGMAVVREGELAAARVLDVEWSLLPTVPQPLGRRTRQLLSLGTAHAEVSVRLLDVEQLRPGERCFAQLRLAQPLAALPGERFIVRGSSALEGRGHTIGGGRVLTLDPPRRKKGAADTLKPFAEADLPGRITWLLTESGYVGLTEQELFGRASAGPRELSRTLEQLAAKGRVLLVDKERRRYLSAEVFAGLSARAIALLEAFHHRHPEREGLPREELRQRLGVSSERTFARLLGGLTEARRLELPGEVARLAGRRASLDARGSSLKEAALAALETAALAPPTHAELAQALKVPAERVVELLTVLVSEGRVHKASELHFAASAIDALERRLVQHLSTHPSLTTLQFKQLVGQSRKFVIPLAELFDARKVTLRVGDTRVLRKR